MRRHVREEDAPQRRQAMDEFTPALDTWTCRMTLLKNYETFRPMGPDVVLTDELPDPGQLGQRTIVNGEVRQDGSMADCWYSVAEIIAWLSTRLSLGAGDLISTGTPPGIAAMAPGDEVVCEIDGVGRLSTPLSIGRAGRRLALVAGIGCDGDHPSLC